ncbi:MAG: hypothetical protein ACI4WR_06835 [Bulleidia sp.]
MAEQQKPELSQTPFAEDEDPLRDYLNNQNQKLFQKDDIQGDYRPEEEEILPVLSNEEVRQCIKDAGLSSRDTASGIFLEITSIAPVVAMVSSSDNLILLSIMLMMAFIASGIVLMVRSSRRMKPYDSYDKVPFELEYGAEDWLKEQQQNYEKSHENTAMKGILFIVFSIAPVLLNLIAESDAVLSIGIAAMFVMIAYGVYLLVRHSICRRWFARLLQTGSYTKETKKDSSFVSSYWGAVTAIYLIFSFVTGTWAYSWLIWPASAAVMGILQNRKESE